MGLKRCFKCGEEKPLTEFYAHPAMGDGHLGKCKDCTRLDVTEHRARNIERVREYDRRRANEPQRIALRNRTAKEWDAKHPEGARAQGRAAHAVRSGRLTSPERCELCGLVRRLEKHHHDYSRPLDVMWLCKPCHAIADKLRRRLERSEQQTA